MLQQQASELMPLQQHLTVACLPQQHPRLSSSKSHSSGSYLLSSCEVDNDPDTMLQLQYLPLVRQRAATKSYNLKSMTTSVIRSLFPSLMNASLFSNMCRLPSLSAVMTPRTSSSKNSRRVVTGTFFGHRKGRISFAVHSDPGSEPLLLLELASPTHQLVKDMASGSVRILLECDQIALPKGAKDNSTCKGNKKQHKPLSEEPVWTMYCNGQRRGYAVSRKCTAFDLHVLSAVRTVSVGAGVLPAVPALTALLPSSPGLSSSKKLDSSNLMLEASSGCRAGSSEVMFMRAKFERVVGSKNSEAFYMLNPDSGSRGGDYGNGGTELSVFLLRI